MGPEGQKQVFCFSHLGTVRRSYCGQAPRSGKPAWPHSEAAPAALPTLAPTRPQARQKDPEKPFWGSWREAPEVPQASAPTSLLRFRAPGWAMVSLRRSAAAGTWTVGTKSRLRRHAPLRQPLQPKIHPTSVQADAWAIGRLTLWEEERKWVRTTSGVECYAPELRVPMETRHGQVAQRALRKPLPSLEVFQDADFIIFVCRRGPAL